MSYRAHVERIWGWRDDEQAEYFERRFRPERLQILVVGGADAGVLEVEELDGELFLANLEIAPEWQGRGIGSSIVRSLQERARSADVPLRLHVLHVNTRARTLYERLGFVEIWRDETRARLEWRPVVPVASAT